MEYGYCRVSSKEQNEDRQIIAMKEAGIPIQNLYIDKESGKDFDRTMYKRLIRKLKEGDTVFVQSIDRFGRNYEKVIEEWNRIIKVKKADIVVLDMPLLDTRKSKDLIGTLISDIVLQLLSYVAQTEREHIKKRQAEGIAAAKARGVKFGRPEIPLPDNFIDVHRRWRNKEISVIEAGKLCGLPRSTFYEKAKKYEQSN